MRQLQLAFCIALITLIVPPSSAEQASGADISVRIVPMIFGEDGGRAITLFDPSQHFHASRCGLLIDLHRS